MAAKQMVMRGAAIVVMMGGVGAYAAQSGLIPGIGNAQTAPQTPVMASAATLAPAAPAGGPAAPAAPVPVAFSPDTPPPSLIAPATDPSASMAAPLPTPAPMPVPIPVPVSVPAPMDAPNEPAGAAPATTDAMPEILADVSPLGLPCEISVTAMAMPAATAALDVMAPCLPDTRVTIEHAGMMLSGQTDALGLLTMDIPALETPAIFTVTFPGGETDTTLVGLPDLAQYDRVAVQWVGDSELELHAMELGAEFGGPGHVWEGAPGEMADAITGTGGFLVEIGSAAGEMPHMAQIYTFPRSMLGAGDNVRFSVDAPITEGTCDAPVSARTFELRPTGDIMITPISLTMPGCDAVGDYLVLQNILRDLRLAAN